MPGAREKHWSNSRSRRENKAETLYCSGNKGRAIDVVLPALSCVVHSAGERADLGITKRGSGGFGRARRSAYGNGQAEQLRARTAGSTPCCRRPLEPVGA